MARPCILPCAPLRYLAAVPVSLLSWTAQGAHLSIIRVRQSSMLDPRAEYVPQAKSTYMYVGRLLADGGARARSTATAAGEYGESVGSFIWANRGADARSC